ncbi:MAG: hypothetical protein ACXWPS_14725, partial [Ktedonobacteraceae bacterium]
QARSASVKPTFSVGLPSLKYTRSFFMGAGARQRMNYCWRMREILETRARTPACGQSGRGHPQGDVPTIHERP